MSESNDVFVETNDERRYKLQTFALLCFAWVALLCWAARGWVVFRLSTPRRKTCICAGRIVDATSGEWESVVWEMEEAPGSALEVCLDSHFALLGLHWFGVVL